MGTRKTGTRMEVPAGRTREAVQEIRIRRQVPERRIRKVRMERVRKVRILAGTRKRIDRALPLPGISQRCREEIRRMRKRLPGTVGRTLQRKRLVKKELPRTPEKIQKLQRKTPEFLTERPAGRIMRWNLSRIPGKRIRCLISF